MKTLKESLLDDIETTMNNGSDLVKDIQKEQKEFLKEIGTIKTFNKLGIRLKSADTLRCHRFIPYTLQQLGFDANAIKIIIGTLDETGDLKLKISIYTAEDRTKMGTIHVKPSWEKKVYIEGLMLYTTSDVVKYILKPASKSIDSFKRLLNNMEKWNEQLVGTKLLLN